eukprot:4523422-Pleurochrysis_carterae.AAC.1
MYAGGSGQQRRRKEGIGAKGRVYVCGAVLSREIGKGETAAVTSKCMSRVDSVFERRHALLH